MKYTTTTTTTITTTTTTSKINTKVENSQNKYFDQLSGKHSTQQLVKIHNSNESHHNCKCNSSLLSRSPTFKLRAQLWTNSLKNTQLFVPGQKMDRLYATKVFVCF